MDKIEYLEIKLAKCNDAIELCENAEKLQKTSLFKKVIGKAYLEDHAVECVRLLSHPGQQDPQRQLSITNSMRGIGELDSWLRGLSLQLVQLHKMKQDLENEIKELHTNPEAFEDDDYTN